jgi:hypothetical protein
MAETLDLLEDRWLLGSPLLGRDPYTGNRVLEFLSPEGDAYIAELGPHDGRISYAGGPDPVCPTQEDVYYQEHDRVVRFGDLDPLVRSYFSGGM